MGKFITFEGGEGCGKSTLIQGLKDYFDKWLPQDLLNYLLTQVQGKEFEFCDNIVSIGDGGLHSVFKTPVVNKITTSLYVEATDEYTMYNVDVSSCYPSVMLFCHAMSRAITKPERLMQIYKRRLNLKLTDKKLWTEEDKKFIANFYKYGFVGIMFEWIQAGMKEDIEELVNKMSLTLHNTVTTSIQNFQQDIEKS